MPSCGDAVTMRVLQLGPYPPPHGGVQANLVAIRNYLRTRQIPCAVINLTRHRGAETGDVYYPAHAWQVAWLLLRLPCDVVHLHLGGTITPRLLALCLFCCLLPHKKSVLTLHSGGYTSSREGRRGHRWTLHSFVFRRFDRIILVNRQMAELFREFGLPAAHIRLISPHSFFATSLEGPLPEPLQSFYQAHSPRLLTVGLLEPEYDLALQIEVLGLIRGRYPNAGLAIIGAGSLERELRAQIRSRPYRDSILLCGDVPHEMTLRAIHRCDLFLRTTFYDGDSVSVREALHLRTPVIATDNKMRPDGVHLVPPGEINSLHEAIELELSRQQPPRRDCLENDERNLEAVLGLYRELVGESR